MLRLCYVVVVSLPFVMYYICKARYIERHDENFSEERRYKMARRSICPRRAAISCIPTIRASMTPWES